MERPEDPDQARRLADDDDAWDAFVAAQHSPAITQLSAWSRANQATGWTSTRSVVATPDGPVGAQLLLHRLRPGIWQRGYAPHGPVGGLSSECAVAELTDELRRQAHRHRLSHVFLDPEIERDEALADWLSAEGWRPDLTRTNRTSIIDLGQDEAAILAGFDRRCRQSIAKSERLGVRVVEGDGSWLSRFQSIHAATMARAGRTVHPESYVRSLWRDLAPRGWIHLYFAVDGETRMPLATILLVGCGRRVVDLYGGTTPEGEARRANHLLKWEAIRRSRAAGYLEYDLCGLPNTGVAEFKRAFGGREVEYIGFWTLVTDPLVHGALGLSRSARAWVGRLQGREEPVGAGTPVAI